MIIIDFKEHLAFTFTKGAQFTRVCQQEMSQYIPHQNKNERKYLLC